METILEAVIDVDLLSEVSELAATFVGVGVSIGAIAFGIGYVITVITRTVRGGY